MLEISATSATRYAVAFPCQFFSKQTLVNSYKYENLS